MPNSYSNLNTDLTLTQTMNFIQALTSPYLLMHVVLTFSHFIIACIGQNYLTAFMHADFSNVSVDSAYEHIHLKLYQVFQIFKRMLCCLYHIITC